MQKKSLARLAMWTAAVIVVVFGVNVGLRTSQWIRNVGEYDDDPRDQTRLGYSQISSTLLREYGQGHSIREIIPWNAADLDEDRDGLDALKEFLSLTLDSEVDSDGDGVNDAVDGCPNCAIVNYRGRVESAIVEGLLAPESNESAQKERVYVCVSYPGSLDAEVPGFTTVVAEDWMFQHVLRLLQGSGGSLEYSRLRLDPLIVIPGLFYAYVAELECGTRCGWKALAYAGDLPFVGPVFLRSRVIELD
jgi:hypothetical protein